ncbi:hypothetical protein [Hugenholtzia roseola]|uniref:hypothetical protein n=1 Tax=Hugenholtzia roseola TaxID=1002 RepID=UPI0003FE0FC8|nr:hypothetical protein [Hugenholtzia roseola]
MVKKLTYIWDFFLTLRHQFVLATYLPDFFRYLVRFIRRGGYSVRTEFEYQPKTAAAPIAFQFHSFIQLDGDIVFYCPHIRRYPTAEWAQTYEKAYQTHLKALDDFIIVMERGLGFIGFLFSLPIFIGVNYKLLDDFVNLIITGSFSENLQQELWSLAIFLGSSFALPFVVKWIAPYAFKVVWYFVKRYFGKKLPI